MSLRLIQLPSIRVIDLLFHGELFQRSAVSSLTLESEQTEARHQEACRVLLEHPRSTAVEAHDYTGKSAREGRVIG